MNPIGPLIPPTGYQIIPLRHLMDELLDLFGLILEVGVHGYDDFPPGGSKPG